MPVLKLRSPAETWWSGGARGEPRQFISDLKLPCPHCKLVHGRRSVRSAPFNFRIQIATPRCDLTARRRHGQTEHNSKEEHPRKISQTRDHQIALTWSTRARALNESVARTYPAMPSGTIVASNFASGHPSRFQSTRPCASPSLARRNARSD